MPRSCWPARRWLAGCFPASVRGQIAGPTCGPGPQEPACWRRSAWHRLRRCSPAKPAPTQSNCPCPVGASLLANHATRWIAPAVPVFAGKPAPTQSAAYFAL
ncbi:hypothetical protein E3U47_14960 [Pseudomonas sp. RIT623]|nr:hypothetical protein E3U47_14960 [Pseudomonas sp. RIT623]